MRIALVHISRGVDVTPISPMVDHLGLGLLAAVLRNHGHEVEILDTGPSGLRTADLKDKLLNASPSLIGFSLNYVNVAESLALAHTIKEKIPTTILVAGGLYATFHAEILLLHGMDVVVLGEGEQPLLQLTTKPSDRRRWNEIPGLVWKEKYDVRRTDPAPGMPLEALPPAARDTLGAFVELPQKCFKVALEASRGCRHACRFCSIASTQRLDGSSGRRRIRNPAGIAREMQEIITRFGLRDFWFMDADFLGGSDEVARQLAIAEAIGSLNEPLTFEMDTRADAVTPEAIAKLQQVGMERVFLGVESFDQASLDRFAKGANVECNRRAVAILEEAGVRPLLGNIMFHPRSSLAQLRREHEILRDIGYEKTQMLFRLKMYRGSRDAGELDCAGRGISFNEDYGWKFEDPVVQLVWDLFDRARLQLMDAVFGDLTLAFRRGEVDAQKFEISADRIFHSLGECMTRVLDITDRSNPFRLLAEKQTLLEEIDTLVADCLDAARLAAGDR